MGGRLVMPLVLWMIMSGIGGSSWSVASGLTVHAQETASDGVPAGSPVTLPRPPIAGMVGERYLLSDLGYGDLTARGIDAVLRLSVPVPAGRQPQPGSQLDLVFDHSPLLLPELSTVTVVVDGRSVTSAYLTPENEVGGRLSVALPTEEFDGNGFLIDLNFHMRLTRDECEEPQNSALWTTVRAGSTVEVVAAPSADGPDLAEVGALLAPVRDGDGAAPIAVVLGPAPSPEEIEAAGLVALQLGR